MADPVWTTSAIVIGAMFGLFVFFLILSARRVDSVKKETKPAPKAVTYGPKMTKDTEKDSDWSNIEKSRGAFEGGVIPLVLKSVVGFYDTIYIGESYSLKIFLFNTAKNAENQEAIIDGLMAKDQQKRYATDTLYAKDQEPVKVKIEIFAPNFIVSPQSRLVEVPAGGTATSTHILAALHEDLDEVVLGQGQAILVSFDQILGEGPTDNPYHLGSLDYTVKLEKAIVPWQQEKEINTQKKISYISAAAGAVTSRNSRANSIIFISSFF
ncbi:MAG: hypothetical protein ACTSQ8_06985 [Candidatus Helarchaeota archaeon]